MRGVSHSVALAISIAAVSALAAPVPRPMVSADMAEPGMISRLTKGLGNMFGYAPKEEPFTAENFLQNVHHPYEVITRAQDAVNKALEEGLRPVEADTAEEVLEEEAQASDVPPLERVDSDGQWTVEEPSADSGEIPRRPLGASGHGLPSKKPLYIVPSSDLNDHIIPSPSPASIADLDPVSFMPLDLDVAPLDDLISDVPASDPAPVHLSSPITAEPSSLNIQPPSPNAFTHPEPAPIPRPERAPDARPDPPILSRPSANINRPDVPPLARPAVPDTARPDVPPLARPDVSDTARPDSSSFTRPISPNSAADAPGFGLARPEGPASAADVDAPVPALVRPGAPADSSAGHVAASVASGAIGLTARLAGNSVPAHIGQEALAGPGSKAVARLNIAATVLGTTGAVVGGTAGGVYLGKQVAGLAHGGGGHSAHGATQTRPANTDVSLPDASTQADDVWPDDSGLAQADGSPHASMDD